MVPNLFAGRPVCKTWEPPGPTVSNNIEIKKIKINHIIVL